MPRRPGHFDTFNGLWSRGAIDDVPSDHFADCLNVSFREGVETRPRLSESTVTPDVVRMQLYKPNPPFSGINIPRKICLKSNGDLVDILLGETIYSNPLMKDFALVNFFGRAYIAPNDGKVGLAGVKLYVYDGTGAAGFRIAGGAPPSVPLDPINNVSPGMMQRGTYFVSYAFETASGFITKPCVPFVGRGIVDGEYFQITGVGLGPPGTVARWMVCTKLFPLGGASGPATGPYNVELALVSPIFFALRIDNNTVGTCDLNFLDASLVDDASYLFTQFESIPAGVGLLDYKGRLVSYGGADDPSLVRVSEIGEPEAVTETSGFIISDPTDSTGVRAATEYHGLLYFYKKQRGYVTQDNAEAPSTWTVDNFEKALGTEAHGIGSILDAKGAQSTGFLIATQGALYYFNGFLVEPELTYKIRDLWDRISEEYFHLTQVSVDPINKVIYILVALDDATKISHIIFGDYADGLSALRIKWSTWTFADNVSCILGYIDFTNDVPLQVTEVATDSKIMFIGEPGNTSMSDDGEVVDTFIEFPPVRFDGFGLSQFSMLQVRAFGPTNLGLTIYGEDKQTSALIRAISITSATPGREYFRKLNFISEQGRLRVAVSNVNEILRITALQLEGFKLYAERPSR